MTAAKWRVCTAAGPTLCTVGMMGERPRGLGWAGGRLNIVSSSMAIRVPAALAEAAPLPTVSSTLRRGGCAAGFCGGAAAAAAAAAAVVALAEALSREARAVSGDFCAQAHDPVMTMPQMRACMITPIWLSGWVGGWWGGMMRTPAVAACLCNMGAMKGQRPQCQQDLTRQANRSGWDAISSCLDGHREQAEGAMWGQ